MKINSVELINHFDHVIVFIWRASGTDSIDHVALHLHQADAKIDVFVSLWSSYIGEKPSLIWNNIDDVLKHRDLQQGPSNAVVFYTLDVLTLIARFNTLKMHTESRVVTPQNQKSQTPDSPFHNCYTAVWNLLKAGGIYGAEGIYTELEFKSVVSTAKMNVSSNRSSKSRHATQFYKDTSNSHGRDGVPMNSSQFSTSMWEASLIDEDEGPNLFFEILNKANQKEKQKMILVDPNDKRLSLCFTDYRELLRSIAVRNNSVANAYV